MSRRNLKRRSDTEPDFDNQRRNVDDKFSIVHRIKSFSITNASKHAVEMIRSYKDFELAMLQFFVFYFERDYEVDERDFNEIKRSQGCASKFLDKLDDKSPTNTQKKYNFAKFIENVLTNLILNEKLDGQTIHEWINFFTFTCDDMIIAKDIKEKADIMAGHFLNSFSHIITLEISNEMRTFLQQEILIILQTRSNSFGSIQATCVLMKSLAENPRQGDEIFKIYEKALACKKIAQQKIILESLVKLSEVETFHRVLIKLFVRKCDSKSFINMELKKFISIKELQENSLKLLLKISQLTRVILDTKIKWKLIEIALNDQVMENLKNVRKIFRNLKLDFYEEIVKIVHEDSVGDSYMSKLNLNLIGNIKNITKALDEKFKVDSTVFLEMACDHANENISKVAFEFFLEFVKFKQNYSEVIQMLHYMLNEYETDNGRCKLLRAFLFIPESGLESFFDENIDELEIVNAILRAFLNSDDKIVEKYALTAVKRLMGVGFEIFQFVEETRDEIFDGLKKFLRNESNIDHAKLFQKLSALLVPQWQLLNDDDLKTFYTYTWNEVKKGRGSPNHELFMRLHVNFLDRILSKFIEENKSLIPVDIFILHFLTIKKTLENFWHSINLDTSTSHDIQCVYAASFIEAQLMCNKSFMTRYRTSVPVYHGLFEQIKKLLTNPKGNLFYKNLLLNACEKLAKHPENIDPCVDIDYKIKIIKLIKANGKYFIK